MTAEVVVHAEADDLAEAIAVRLSARVAELQRRDPGHLVTIALTGGRIATAAYRRLAADSGPVDWSRVALWWGDERFVAGDSEDRNDAGALQALRPALPLAEQNVHPMPSTGSGTDLDGAAEAYARQLGDTRFDICLLGVGPDGHVASLFPDHVWSTAVDTVIAVRDSPKPPPERISLTLPTINASAEVWFTVAGADKAEAVAASVRGDDLPCGRARGADRTLWLLDRAAAAALPHSERSDSEPSG